MAYEFRLPDLGEGLDEGEVVHWLVQEGDLVKEEQPIVEVMTDKVTVEIPSPRAGTVLKICVGEGDVVPVGTTLLTIGEPGEAAGDGKPAPAEALAPPAANGQAPATDGGRILAVPAVRQLARDLGVDLESVTATGPGGRITFTDVRAAAGGGRTTEDEGRLPARSGGAPAEQVATKDEAPPSGSE